MSPPPSLGTAWRVYSAAQASNLDLGDNIPYSARFNSSDSAYMSWTHGSGGSRKKWIFSGWFKRGKLGVSQYIFATQVGTASDSVVFRMGWESDDQFRVIGYSTTFRRTNRVFRDPSAWFHLVVSCDTTADDGERFRVWINGEEETSWQTSNDPSSDADLAIGNNVGIYLGCHWGPAGYYDGYMAQVRYLNGVSIQSGDHAITDFGRFSNSHENIWVPIDYTGSYDANGFYLDFATNSDLGNDVSGNDNDWTSTNLATNDRVVDSPTQNYAVLNYVDKDSAITLSDGNLTASNSSSSNYHPVLSSMAFDSEHPYGFYFEVSVDSNGSYDERYKYVGIVEESASFNELTGAWSGISKVAAETDGWRRIASYGSSVANLSDLSAPYVIQVFVRDGKVWFGDDTNGWWDVGDGAGDPDTDTNPSVTGVTGYVKAGLATLGGQLTARFLRDQWTETPPSGARAICTSSFEAPTVDKPWEHFSVLTWAGSSLTRSISGAGFQPDLVWIKSRGSTQSHQLFDVLRGPSYILSSNSTSAQSYDISTLSSFDSDGYSLGNSNATNQTGYNFVGWNWKAGGSGVANNDGTISSTVSVADTGHFSIITHTGTGSNGTIGHGLPGAPEFHVTKQCTSVTTARNWTVGGSVIGGGTSYMGMNSTAAVETDATAWNSTLATSTVIHLGSFDGVNGNTDTYITYAFRSVEGICKIGTYTGNGSDDGPFVYCGFRPRWIMWKRTDSTSKWEIFDTEREPYNAAGIAISANTNGTESGAYIVDILSNGFKFRHSTSTVSSANYIFIAMAEIPFGGSNVPLGPAR